MNAPVTPQQLKFRLEPLRPFLDDETLNEICINRPGEVWTEGRAGFIRHEIPALDFDHLMNLAKLIASAAGKSISAEKPILSAGLPTGERSQIVIPPACEPGTISITIRKPSIIDKTIEELDNEGSFNECVEVNQDLQLFEHELLSLKQAGRFKEFLEKAVTTHRNILVVGKTGSGKTTITKSLIRSIPADERIITIEDVPELSLKHHKNKVHLFYSSEEEGGATVSARQALKSCLRMRPDRILLAELRGDESWDFIKSVNTGHPGSISTMHANGAFAAFEQLTALIKDSKTGAHLETDFIKHRLFTTIDIVLFYHMRKLREVWYDPAFKHQHMG